SPKDGRSCLQTRGAMASHASTSCSAAARLRRSHLHLPFTEGTGCLGYTRRASKEVAATHHGWFSPVRPSRHASQPRHHRLGRVARSLDLFPVVEGRLRDRSLSL